MSWDKIFAVVSAMLIVAIVVVDTVVVVISEIVTPDRGIGSLVVFVCQVE